MTCFISLLIPPLSSSLILQAVGHIFFFLLHGGFNTQSQFYSWTSHAAIFSTLRLSCSWPSASLRDPCHPYYPYYHLRSITRLRWLLSQQEAEPLIHAFITRLDHYNLWLASLPECSLPSLDFVGDSAAGCSAAHTEMAAYTNAAP